MSAPNNRVLEWLRKRRTDLTERGLISRVELWHAVDGEGGQRLEVFDIAEREEDEDIDELCIEIWNAAEEDASTRPQGSHQRYVIMLFRGEEDKDPEESKSFNIQGAMLSHLLGAGSDLPNERGLLGQDLRQRNEMHALMLRMAEGMAGGMERQLKAERDWSMQLEIQRRRALETEQTMLDRSSERELERKKAEKAEERLDMIMNVITGLAPMVLSKLFEAKTIPTPQAPSGGMPPSAGSSGGGSGGGGGGGGPGRPPIPGMPTPDAVRHVFARDAAVSNVLGTLQPEQLQTLSQVLRPDQAMAFVEIYSSYKDEQATKHAVRTPPSDFRHGEETHGNEETH